MGKENLAALMGYIRQISDQREFNMAKIYFRFLIDWCDDDLTNGDHYEMTKAIDHIDRIEMHHRDGESYEYLQDLLIEVIEKASEYTSRDGREDFLLPELTVEKLTRFISPEMQTADRTPKR